jgi:hypothetical protein
MVANYLQRIVLAGSRRAAPVRPVIGGPPLMPALVRPLRKPSVEPFASFQATERRDDGVPAAQNKTNAPEPEASDTETRQQDRLVPPAPPLVSGVAESGRGAAGGTAAPRGEALSGVDQSEEAVDSPPPVSAALAPSPHQAEPDAAHPMSRGIQAPIIRMPLGLRRGAPKPPADLSLVPLATVPEEFSSQSPSVLPSSPMSVTTNMARGATTKPGPSETTNVTDTGHAGSSESAVDLSGNRPQLSQEVVVSNEPGPPTEVTAPMPGNSGPVAASVMATSDPVPAPSTVRLLDSRSRPRVGTETFSNEPAPSARADEHPAIAPDPRWMTAPAPQSAGKAKAENRITIGRVEVEVNNVSPQISIVTSPHPTAASRAATTVSLGSYYLDRFSLRP